MLFPLIPGAARSIAQIDAISEHREGFRSELQLRRAGLTTARPGKSPLFQTLEARNTLRQEATSLIIIG